MDKGFLPINKEEMQKRGWQQPDFVYVSGDAYVDHPSFGTAIISRILEQHGYKVCILAQTGIFSVLRKYGLHGKSLFCFQKEASQ